VELGECANEWRGFKFWSVNQIPHTSAVRVPTMMEEDKEYYNPLLEEYVDGLHFVLELGLN
jgi:dimeric dUTPase (all-alpha-NTP-PPase superfamily)